MIKIGLDISKISTALCIDNNNKIKLYSYTTKKDNNIWITETSDFINYRFIDYKYPDEIDYSKREIIKLKEFNEITSIIFNDILDNINILDNIQISIEGYSYNSSKGPIIDIVEFSTMLKYKLLTQLKGYVQINIVSPLTLKLETCKKIYKPRIELKGKKVIKEILHYENNNGKQATKFDKRDMFLCYLDSDIKHELKDYIDYNQEKILKLKDIPKPFDDIIDSFWLCKML